MRRKESGYRTCSVRWKAPLCCPCCYERQFVTRQDLNLGAIAKFEKLVDEYIASGKTGTEGLPTVKYFADKVFLSPNYFGDMVKAETGKTAQEYIAVRLFSASQKTVDEWGKSL